MEGVETCMLVALSLLAVLGLRYPMKMLPILLFEIGWKFIWVRLFWSDSGAGRPACDAVVWLTLDPPSRAVWCSDCL